MPDNALLLRAALRDATGEWPAAILHFESVTSTNDVLREAARSGAAAWTVALADEQTAGRGRQGRQWLSPPGNLHLSVLLRPEVSAERLGLVPLAAGIAAARAARDCGAEALLKWPNDVWVGGRKLGGILVEAHSSSSGVEDMIVGCGMNVALQPPGLPVDLPATSLREVTGKPQDTIAVAARFLTQLRSAHDLLSRDPAALRVSWKELSLPWWGRPIEVRSGDSVVRGVLVDLDEGGGVILETAAHRRVTVVSGEARAIRLA